MEVATSNRKEQEMLERRNFLGGLAGASLGVLSDGIFNDSAGAQNRVQVGENLVDHDSFETSQVEVSGNTIFLRRYGKGPAILLVHGFPRTSLMWRFLAPKLAENHT
jgi:haloacetate dehalogenase